MRRITPLFSLLTALSLGSILAQERNPPQETIDNVRELVDKLHILNAEEIRAGELAQQKGASDGVRDYGRQLVQDHRQNDQKLKQLADAKGFEWEEEPELPPEKKQLIERLQSLSGEEFNRTFAREMASGHEKAIQMLTDARDRLKDAEARELVSNTLPVLERHLQTAKRLQGSTTE